MAVDYKVTTFEKHSDRRGELVVFLKQSELKKNDKKFGQIYFITFNRKGVIRGNHYHKKWREWFGVVNGTVKAELENVKTGERKTLLLSADHKHYTRLEIGPYIAHAFKSVSSSASLLNYGDKEWSGADRFTHTII